MLPPSALPGLGTVDPRITVDPRHAPWSAVAALRIAGVSRCTAVMVAANVAATAAHCLYNRRLQRVVPLGSIHLMLGYDGGDYTRHIVPDSVRFAPGADPGGSAARASDVALLHFADPVTDTLTPTDTPVVPGTPLWLGGFGQDRAERLAVDPGCEAVGYARAADGGALLLHDCSGTRGTSGGAVLMQDAAGAWRLAGIQVSASFGQARGSAVPGEAIARLMAGPP